MKIKIYFIIFILLSLANYSEAQNEKFKALYIYNITKYIHWETEETDKEFIIAVLGTSDIIEELKVIAKKRTINEQTVTIVKYNSVSEISDCQILYIPSGKSDLIYSLSSKTLKCLVITEKSGMTKNGAAINFIEKEGVLKFEVNTDNITKYDLKYNSELLNFAVK